MSEIQQKSKKIIKLLNDINNDECNEEIKIKLSFLIKKYTIVDNLLNDKLYNLALALIEKLKQWRTHNINNYLFSSNDERCKELIDNLLQHKLNVMTVVYRENNII
jgi:hypothetical protein